MSRGPLAKTSNTCGLLLEKIGSKLRARLPDYESNSTGQKKDLQCNLNQIPVSYFTAWDSFFVVPQKTFRGPLKKSWAKRSQI